MGGRGGRIVRRIWQTAWDLWLHHRKIKDSVDHCVLPGLHAQLDDGIDAAFVAFRQNPQSYLTPLVPAIS